MFTRLRTSLSRLIAPAESMTAARRFDGAASGRRGGGIGNFGKLNAEIGAAGQALASRGAYLSANQPYVGNAVSNWVGALIGSGIRATSRHPDESSRAALNARFDRWSEDADAEGRTDFAGILANAARELVVSGEAFLLVEWTDRGFQLRQIAAEQVDRTMTRQLDNGITDVQGIRFDANGRRVGYWIHPTRETDQFTSWAPPVFVPAENVLHLMKPLGPGQVRGVSWLAPIVLQAAEFDKLCDGLLMAVSVGAMFAGVITDENNMGGAADPFDGDTHPSLEPGTLIRLGGGQKVTFSTPQQASETTAFLKQNLQALAAGLGLPTHYLDNDLTGANFSSLRAGLLPFKTRVEAIQYQVLAPQILRPVWQLFVRNEILLGNLEQTEFDSAMGVDWIMPAFLALDQTKQVEADLAELNGGLTSRAKLIAARGWSAEELDREIAADRARESALGLQFSAPKDSAP